MTHHNHPMRATLGLALALAAIAPAAASARPNLDPPAAVTHQPAVQVVRVPAGGGFDWRDAAIGGVGAVGLSMLAVGGGLVIVGRRRRSSRAARRGKLGALRSKWILVLVLGAAGSAVCAGSVLATPSSGLSTTILAQSEFNSFLAEGHAFPPAWGALMAGYGLTDIYVVDNKFDPGGTTGWHTHPGPSLILVVSGQVTNYTSEDRNCNGHTYAAGQGFIDSGGNDEHTLRNNGTTEAETIAVQLIPHGAPRKIDEPNPTRCPV